MRFPQHGEDRDIFERLYAVRLDQIRASAECREVLCELDAKGLLGESGLEVSLADKELDDEELLAELGVCMPPRRLRSSLYNCLEKVSIAIIDEIDVWILLQSPKNSIPKTTIR